MQIKDINRKKIYTVTKHTGKEATITGDELINYLTTIRGLDVEIAYSEPKAKAKAEPKTKSEPKKEDK